MDTTHLKKLLDACFTAKYVIETLPELPSGMKPRHIHVLDMISTVSAKQSECRVSSVSQGLNITMPSVTKLVQELEAMGLVEKYSDKGDKRVTLLKLTEKGSGCVRKYVHDLHREWASNLSSVSNEQALAAIHVIQLLEKTMPDR